MPSSLIPSAASSAARPAGRRPHQDDAPVVRIADPLHQAPFDHPVDEARGVRHRNIQQIRDPTHRDRALPLQLAEDVELRHAQAVDREPIRHGAPQITEERADLDQHLADELLACVESSSSHRVKL